MADIRTISETFPKRDGWNSEEVDEQRRQRMVAGAISCEKTEDEENFYLNSVWQVAGTQANAGMPTTGATEVRTLDAGRQDMEPTVGAREGDSVPAGGVREGDSEAAARAGEVDSEPTRGAEGG